MNPREVSCKSDAAPGQSAHHGGDPVLQCAQFWRDFPLAGA
jgi:hypothetical protein